MFSNLSADCHVSLSDSGINDALGFNTVQDENVVEKSLWDYEFTNINETFQEIMQDENFGVVRLDSFGTTDGNDNEDEELHFEFTDSVSVDNDASNFDKFMINSFEYDSIYTGNLTNKSASNQTLSTINGTFQETAADENCGINIFGVNNEMEENLVNYLGVEEYEYNYNDSIYEELTDLDTILKEVIKEDHHDNIEVDQIPNNNNNSTNFISDDSINVMAAGKLFVLKNAKVVLERLPASIIRDKTKNTGIPKSYKKTYSSYKLFNRYCPQCEDIAVNQESKRNDLKCRTCKIKLTFQCRECHVKCDTYGRMMYHVKTKLCEFQTSEKNCMKCGKNFGNLQSLKRHFSYCTRKSNFQCNFCSYKTKSQRDLDRHEQVKHN